MKLPAVRLPTTQGRVPRQSYDTHNEKINNAAIASIKRFADASPDEVTRRLGQLGMEWDMERTLEMNAAFAATTGLILGLLVDTRWFLLTATVLSFLAQHAIQGYCPPMFWFRAYGWRTSGEIEDEATALRMLHGRSLPSIKTADKSRLLAEMMQRKRDTGRFIGESPEKEATVAEQSSVAEE